MKMNQVRFFLTILVISGMLLSVSLGKKTKKPNKVTYKKLINVNGIQVKTYIEVIGGKENRKNKIKTIENPRSCLDHLKNGETETKVYKITTPSGVQQVLCDLTSEPGSAWTLVLSHQLEYRHKDTIAPFKKTLTMNFPVNEKSPNYNMYRMTLAQMTNIKSHSTHWRVTCNGPSVVDYRDYLRVRFADFDPLTFIGGGVCKKVEYINIRGHVGIEVTVPFWQYHNRALTEILHHDSSAGSCSYGATPGHVSSEDNFGLYRFINRNFRCSARDFSTSNMWFGAYL